MTNQEILDELQTIASAKLAIYETVLAGLLASSPISKEIRQDVQKLSEELRGTHGEDSQPYKIAASTVRSLFGA